MNKPSAFTHVPSYGERRELPGVPAQEPVYALPVYNPAHHIPPPPEMPAMTISPTGMLYIPKPAMLALRLKAGSRIALEPPHFGSKFWHLDLRDEAPRSRSIEWAGAGEKGARAQSARVKGLALPPGLVTANLILYLLPGTPTHAHYYPLLPAHALTT